MKSTKLVQKFNKSIFDLSSVLKKKITLLLLLIILLVVSCKTDNEISTNFVYGLSTPRSYSFVPQDSVIQINMTDGTYKNLFSTDKFEGLKSFIDKVYSKNLNILAYKIDDFKIGFINLDNLSSDVIDFKSDSTLYGIRTLSIIEKKNVLIAVNVYHTYPGSTKSLELVEIDLKTKTIISRLKLIDTNNQYYYLFSEIDEKNNRIFIIPNNYVESNPNYSDNLYIYNYESKKLITQPLKTSFLDVHYSSNNQCLIGSSYTKSGIGLVTYSINNQKSDTIGSYADLWGIRTKMSYYDTKNNLYWLGVILLSSKKDIPLTNIKLSDAGYSKSISFQKQIDIIK